jgi:hypothetical protein
LLGAAQSLREAIGASMGPFDSLEYQHCLTAAQKALDEDALTLALEEGQAMTLEQAIACALQEGAE